MKFIHFIAANQTPTARVNVGEIKTISSGY